MDQGQAGDGREGGGHQWDCSSLPALAASLEAEARALESACVGLNGRAWMVLHWRASTLMGCADQARGLAAMPNDQTRWLTELEMKSGPDLLHLGKFMHELWEDDHKLAAVAAKFAVDVQFKPAVWRAIAGTRRLSQESAQDRGLEQVD